MSGAVGDGADKALTFLYFLGFLVLVVSALAARRLPWGQTAKLAAAWVLIFGAAFVAFSLKDDFLALGRHVVALNGGGGEAGAGGTLRIPRGEDGHFWVAGSVNGAPVRFLVDSGATVTSLSDAAAAAAHVDPADGLPVMVATANGVVRSRRGMVAQLAVGPIRRTDFPVHIGGGPGGMDLLGMNFLSSLRGWSVDGNTLVLRP